MRLTGSQFSHSTELLEMAMENLKEVGLQMDWLGTVKEPVKHCRLCWEGLRRDKMFLKGCILGEHHPEAVISRLGFTVG